MSCCSGSQTCAVASLGPVGDNRHRTSLTLTQARLPNIDTGRQPHIHGDPPLAVGMVCVHRVRLQKLAFDFQRLGHTRILERAHGLGELLQQAACKLHGCICGKRPKTLWEDAKDPEPPGHLGVLCRASFVFISPAGLMSMLHGMR